MSMTTMGSQVLPPTGQDNSMNMGQQSQLNMMPGMMGMPNMPGMPAGQVNPMMNPMMMAMQQQMMQNMMQSGSMTPEQMQFMMQQ